MRAAVVLREALRIAQTKSGRQVDYFHAGRESRRDFHRLSLRQSEEGAIKICQTLELLRRLGEFQISQPEEIAMHFADCFPGVLVRGNDSNLSVWMRQQNPQQFRTAVARAAENCNSQFHVSGFRFQVPGSVCWTLIDSPTTPNLR